VDDRQGEGAFFSLPDVSWDEIEPDLRLEILKLSRSLGATVDHLRPSQPELSDVGAQEGPGLSLRPAQVALRCYELASQLWSAVSGPEQDLRQVITTLRTALAVCWDLYSPRQMELTTVEQHMERLKATIEDFQKDLANLQREAGKPHTPESAG
jgi:hypothetical protein